MTLKGFEPPISASELQQTNALDRAAIGIGDVYMHLMSLRIATYNNEHSGGNKGPTGI